MLRDWRRKLELSRWAADHLQLPDGGTPDDWPKAARLETNGLMPLRHGEHAPGHSAVYAAANAVRLATAAHHGWTKRGEEELLAKAWAWRDAHRPNSPQRGMRRSDFARMVEALTTASRRQHDQYITVRPAWSGDPPGQSDFFATVERCIVAQDVILILIAGAQYSIVRGFTPTSLLLFDSGGRHWMKRASITLIGSGLAARHALATKATLLVRRGC